MKKPSQIAEKLLKEFDRLPLSVRFFLALLLPVVAILWMSMFNGVELYRTTQYIKQLDVHTGLAIEAGLLVGLIQRERGISTIFLGSQGGLLGEQLTATRHATDRQLASLQTMLGQPEVRSCSSALVRNLTAISRSLALLPEVRKEIDQALATPEEARDFFTHTIESFNNQIGRLSSQSSQNYTSRKLNAYYILNQLRELLGKERAILSQALVHRQLTKDNLHSLIYLAGAQDNAQALFAIVTAKTGFNKPLLLDSDATVFRDQLLGATDPESLLQNLTVEEWFSLQSDRMHEISLVEAELTDDIRSRMSGLLAAASQELWRYLIITPLVLLVALAFTLLIFRHIQARLRLIETVFEYTNDRVTVTDARANIVEVNQAFTRITGYSRAEVLGKNPKILKSGRQDQAFYRGLWSALKNTGSWQGEIWNRRKEGAIYAELTTINAVQDRKGRTNYYVAVSSDITDRAFEHQRQLEHRAYHDPLTGLPNQTLLRDRLEHALNLSKRSNRQIVVACVDLDHFKSVNDQYGHTNGDNLLELVSQRIRSVLRDSDSLGRTGGDEFLVVLEEADDNSQANQILARVQQELGSPFTLSGSTLSLTASIGATCFPQDAGDADSLIRHATQALHESKHNGRSRLSWFDPEKGQNQNALSHLIGKLEKAVNNNELRLYYQPKVNMVTGKLLGAEALLRWQDPLRGLIPPGEFLPQIEHHPFSILIGEWVLEAALSQIEHWQSTGLSITVSINVNARQLLDPGFVTSLKAHMERHPNLSPQSLELEILESAALDDIRRAGDVLKECRDLGIGISLDDFGTGYAALEYLKRLPAESLKIDQTFVRDMLDNAGDAAIVKGIVGLADAFGFKVIAEGVETEEQGCALISIGCTDAQGYGIARPMPPEQFASWLAAWQPPASWQAQ